jgi:hydroxymethylpyrimidine pyrophosphatase-like HAD family hydrolase
MVPRTKVAAFDFDGTLTVHSGYISASSVRNFQLIVSAEESRFALL